MSSKNRVDVVGQLLKHNRNCHAVRDALSQEAGELLMHGLHSNVVSVAWRDRVD